MTSKVTLVVAAVLLGIGGSATLSAADLGLTVNRQGTLLHHGRPYRGIGVNYFDAFIRVLRNPADVSYREGFDQLGANSIPFARIAAGGYSGQDWQAYVSDKDSYFRRLDDVVASAEKAHVGLIVSLFWAIGGVSDVVNEPPAKWGDRNSATRQFMRRYTREIVSRYAKSPAIWGWEFSCELSLPIDRRPGEARLGRNLEVTTFQNAALDFAQVVRGIDPDRILLTGNSLPRPDAYHNTRPGPSSPDTREQFGKILLRDNPGPFNPVCIHTTPTAVPQHFADRKVSYQELIETSMQVAKTAGKAVYLEEFVPAPQRPQAWGAISDREFFTNELQAIQASGVPIASVWVYDRKLARDRTNVTFSNERSYALDMISAFNRAQHAQW